MGRLAVCAMMGGSLFATTGARAQSTIPSVPPASGPSTPQAASTNPPSSADAPPVAPAAAEAAPTVGEIIVTAQRRSENLQNVPIAVTAVTAAKLSSAGVSGTSDLSLVVPGLNLEASIGYAQPRLRGVGTTANGPGVENPVATYIDGVYTASAPASLLSFNNISQIEVLKGPQGTLFGRNATGGLIQITTPNPSATPRGDVAVSYGAYDTSRIDGYVTGGLMPGVAADLAVQLGHQATDMAQTSRWTGPSTGPTATSRCAPRSCCVPRAGARSALSPTTRIPTPTTPFAPRPAPCRCSEPTSAARPGTPTRTSTPSSSTRAAA